MEAVSVNFGISTKGHKILQYNKFEYLKARENRNGEIYWRCKMYKRHKCNAHLKTVGDQVVYGKEQEHTHEADLTTSLVRLAVAQMKEKMSETSAMPSAVIGTVSSQLDDHVLQALPKRSSLVRSLQRRRKAALANNSDELAVRQKWEGLPKEVAKAQIQIKKFEVPTDDNLTFNLQYLNNVGFIKDHLNSPNTIPDYKINDEETTEEHDSYSSKAEDSNCEPSNSQEVVYIKTEDTSEDMLTEQINMTMSKRRYDKDTVQLPDHLLDDDHHFALSLVPYLRTLPTHRKLFVRAKFQEILAQEHEELHRYENSQQKSSTELENKVAFLAETSLN